MWPGRMDLPAIAVAVAVAVEVAPQQAGIERTTPLSMGAGPNIGICEKYDHMISIEIEVTMMTGAGIGHTITTR